MNNQTYPHLKDRIVSVDLPTRRVELIIPGSRFFFRSIGNNLPFLRKPFTNFEVSICDRLYIYCRGVVEDEFLFKIFCNYLKETHNENKRRILNAK